METGGNWWSLVKHNQSLGARLVGFAHGHVMDIAQRIQVGSRHGRHGKVVRHSKLHGATCRVLASGFMLQAWGWPSSNTPHSSFPFTSVAFPISPSYQPLAILSNSLTMTSLTASHASLISLFCVDWINWLEGGWSSSQCSKSPSPCPSRYISFSHVAQTIGGVDNIAHGSIGSNPGLGAPSIATFIAPLTSCQFNVCTIHSTTNKKGNIYIKFKNLDSYTIIIFAPHACIIGSASCFGREFSH